MNEHIQRIVSRLPLHRATSEVILAYLSKQQAQYPTERIELVEPLNDFLRKGGHQGLQRLVFHVHFQLMLRAPEHLRLLRRHREELQRFWPYERHHSLLALSDVRSQSLRRLWEDGQEEVLQQMQYCRHHWLREGDVPERYALTQAQREEVLHRVFAQYMFLKQRPALWSVRRLPIPVVEIGMTPLGFDIPDVRVDGLFKDKTKSVLRLLYREHPALTPAAEEDMLRIIAECPTRAMRRIYLRACRRAYVLDADAQLFRVSRLRHFI
ncbi:AGR082Cp [Eremothecium gossypii ATCC 10895]|uniref:Genetic interactor of prohibitin 5, mitochondrial n=1 Tax=Eremothecium gossypii (strain ATCC 10895 / CBS 109.51 / FGSC 9923 / NRRL Y-1056) TaxID=284811 RepID=GEP5_EREGS|nr:AGR082Cp [Eremothecium gossypii ATCC 10895]Q74ZX6.1 RecName: Full=Genetic interactor of prohibitin 5, mitochondrial; AltName: Full=Required for respiratory growth protein 5 [Eremothecium gossypii ATCC 10895]AAS54571.1 AGR082Cp [Eremothecium gossypii ATCC 10895]AEY98903.1 FAGR082Cp [Eremothecium gossypii FDAG1]